MHLLIAELPSSMFVLLLKLITTREIELSYDISNLPLRYSKSFNSILCSLLKSFIGLKA